MIKKINFNEYIKQFKQIAKDHYNNDMNILFKVDLIKDHKKEYKYYKHERGAVCIEFIDNKTINIKGLIAYNGGGGALLRYIIKKYSNDYNIILDSFISNDSFYTKNGFKQYKISEYNPVYDPYNYNKNKESVIYYYYDKKAAAV